MTTGEIVKTLRSRSREPRPHAILMVAMWKLKKRGYDTRYIAMAFGVHRTLIPYVEKKVSDLTETHDEYVLNAKEILSTHIIDLFPYFDKKTKKIRTYVKIDNIKL